MPTSLPDEGELLRRAKEGDERAFRDIVHRYENRVAATVIGMLGPGPEAEDVGQETFVRLFKALGRFRGDSSLGTYVTRIAINQSLKAIKKRKNWSKRFVESQDDTMPDAGESTGDVAPLPDARLEHAELVRIGMDALTPDQRAVVTLRLIEGHSTRQTAEILGVAEGTVLSRLSRGLSSMRETLRPHMGEEADGP